MQTHLLYTALKFGEEVWRPLEERLLAFTHFTGLKKLPTKGIFKKPTKKVHSP